MANTFSVTVIVLTSLLEYFLISADFSAVKSSHVLLAHPKNFYTQVTAHVNCSTEFVCPCVISVRALNRWFISFKYYNCFLACSFSLWKSVLLLIQYYLESLAWRIKDLQYGNSQEWRAKCKHQKCYQRTIKSSCIISLQTRKKDTITLSMFPDFLSICGALKYNKNLYGSSHCTSAFFCTLLIYRFCGWNDVFLPLMEQ